jgi:hypothetical protein
VFEDYECRVESSEGLIIAVYALMLRRIALS